MSPEQQEEAGPVTVQIGVCSVCHALFLMSGDRLTSPCHGADPLAVLATLTIGLDGEVDGVWGSHLPRPLITREEAISMFEALGFSRQEAEKQLPPEEPAPAPAPPEEPPAEEAREEAPETIKASELLPVVIVAFLEGDLAADAEQLKGMFEDAGAEPEAASTAVGRLEAVRNLLRALQEASGSWATTRAERLGAESPAPTPTPEPTPVAAAPSEAEKSPEVS